MSNHTPGPWFADSIGRIWRRRLTDLYEYGGGVAGDKPLANVNKGWYGEEEAGFPVKANACLIAAAPELLKALKELYALVEGECPSLLDEDSGGDSRLDIEILSAIAKATGEQP